MKRQFIGLLASCIFAAGCSSTPRDLSATEAKRDGGLKVRGNQYGVMSAPNEPVLEKVPASEERAAGRYNKDAKPHIEFEKKGPKLSEASIREKSENRVKGLGNQRLISIKKANKADIQKELRGFQLLGIPSDRQLFIAKHEGDFEQENRYGEKFKSKHIYNLITEEGEVIFSMSTPD